MRIHFSAAEPCALRLGGVFAGYCGETEKFADIGEEALLAEFIPAGGDNYPLSFVLNKSFFARPPHCCDLFRYACGADVFAARFAPREGGMRVLTQVRAGKLLLSVLETGGRAQAATEGTDGGALLPLPPARDYTAEAVYIGGQPFAALFCKGKQPPRLLLFAETGACALNCRCTFWEAGSELRVRHTLADAAGHTIEQTFSAEGGTLRETARTVTAREGFCPDALPARILPFALFEEIAAGGDPAPYLAPAQRERAPLLREYLGDFCAVTVPKEIFYLTYGTINAAGLVYRRGENLFDVKFFTADTENGKITNVRPVE